MKLRKVILTGLVLSGSLLANTLGDATSLIEQIKTVSSEQRFELMNKIKSNILSLNNNDRTEALKQMRETRQGLRETKLAKIKAELSPTELVAFEARLKARAEARAEAKKNYRERMANLSEEQKQEMREDSKKRKSAHSDGKTDTSGRTNRNGRAGRVGNNSTNKIITSKVYTTVPVNK